MGQQTLDGTTIFGYKDLYLYFLYATGDVDGENEGKEITDLVPVKVQGELDGVSKATKTQKRRRRRKSVQIQIKEKSILKNEAVSDVDEAGDEEELSELEAAPVDNIKRCWICQEAAAPRCRQCSGVYYCCNNHIVCADSEEHKRFCEQLENSNI